MKKRFLALLLALTLVFSLLPAALAVGPDVPTDATAPSGMTAPTAPTAPTEPSSVYTVTFQLHTDTDVWIQPAVVSVSTEGTTVLDVFRQVLAANGYTYDYDADYSYLRAVTAPDGTKVAEFSKGKNSGWLYRVNGDIPDVAMNAFQLEDGDEIEVFFTADYMQVPGMVLPFTDVSWDHWAYTAIKRMYTRNLMVGVDDKTFAPDLTLTRAMLAVILYARAGEPAVTAENKFSDVPTGQWYTNAVIWAAENGIVAGCGDGTFRPDAAVTRAQAAVMLCGFAAFSGDDVTARADLSAFGDAADVPSWAQAELQWTVARQLIVGRDGKLLAPNDAVTRAEMASILTFANKHSISAPPDFGPGVFCVFGAGVRRCGALWAVRFARECGRKKDLQPRRAVIHYDRNCILRSLRRFGRQGECG